jgi:hypothetical protein
MLLSGAKACAAVRFGFSSSPGHNIANDDVHSVDGRDINSVLHCGICDLSDVNSQRLSRCVSHISNACAATMLATTT